MKLSDLYLVKFKNIVNPDVPIKDWYGVVRQYGYTEKEKKTIQKAWDNGSIIVDDCIFPRAYALTLADAEPVEMSFSPEEDSDYKFHADVLKHFEDRVPEKFGAGSMFSLPVADGRATYLVRAIQGNNANIDWFGAMNQDRYTDHHFGWGGKFPAAEVKNYVERELAMKSLFSKK